MSKPPRAELFAYVLAPIMMFWGLVLFAPSSMSALSRLGVGVVFTLVWGPVMYLRVKN